MKLFISTGNSRMEKHWNGREIELEEFAQRISATIRTSETVEQYRKLSKARQDGIKDVGGFVLGKLKGGRRKKDCVVFRSGLTLDMDYATADIPEQIEMFFDFRCLIYSTHKHTPEHPRLRLIIPLSRNVSPDEYTAVARKVAEEIGMELFDDTTYEPSRLMYWPSTSSDGEFVFRDIEGDILNPDTVLAKYRDWKDSSEWPVSSRQQSVVQREMKKQADPLVKDGVVGAFCRTYSIEEAVAEFLSDVYQPSAMPGRYDYIPADSQAGVVVYEGKFAYSHHATDPACGKLMNAFDMVRIHKFGELDAKSAEDGESTKLPSYKATSEFAVKDEKVKLQLVKEREESAKMEFQPEKEWQSALELDRQGKVKDTLDNLVLAIRNDGKLQSIAFNLHRDGIDAGDVLQIWAEAKDAYQKGERLYLEGEVAAMATSEQAEAMETDDREGLVRTYLDTLLPENWDAMSLYDRRNFLNGNEFGESQRTGTVRRNMVCNMEIWCECFGRDSSALKKIDSYEISGIMRKIEGWTKYTLTKNGVAGFSIYGKQRAYIREQDKK